MQLVVRPDGQLRYVYAETIQLATLGRAQIRRASHVEADAESYWFADLYPVGGPRLRPFEQRSTALAAEQAWLERNWLNGVFQSG